jgi:hypothetical protein
MTALFIITAVLALIGLAPFYGVDSRDTGIRNSDLRR